jgi:hypothetical protein
LAGVALAATALPHLRKLPPGEGLTVNYGFVFGIIASLSCIANASAWPWAPSGGVYLLTLWSIVAIAAGNFVELIFRKVL